MKIMMKLMCFSLLVFAATGAIAQPLLSESRKEILNICADASRKLIKEKYFENNPVTFVEMVTWLSAEDSKNYIYKFTSSAKLRKEDSALYSWTFTAYTQFSNHSCKILSEKLEFETKLIEDEENQENED